MNEEQPRSRIPGRLVDESARAGSEEELAAACLRSASRIPALGLVPLARIAARLAADGEGAPARPRLHWKTIVAVVALGVGAGGATGAAVWVVAPLVRARHAAPAVIPRALPEPTPSAPRAKTAVPAAAPAPAETAPAETAPAETAPTAVAPDRPTTAVDHHLGPVAHRTVARVEPPAPTPPGSVALAQEAELVGVALRRLRNEHDPRSALAALDEHAARFGDGVLRPEAEIARVEALLALDRRSQALAILNGLSLPDSARGRELSIVRAELRAGDRRCPDAVADFTRALADPALDGALTERALHGRAACNLAGGNRPAARSDLDAYLLRFPEGRFAADSRRALAAIGAAGVESFPSARVTGAGGRSQ